MEIRKVHVSLLNPAAYNPRKDLQPGDTQYDSLQRSITEFGYIDPIVWNGRTGNVVGGHQRLKILTDRGDDEIDVSVVDLDEAREKALNLALNKISGAWDSEKLAIVLEDLMVENSIDIELTGFSEEELSQYLVDEIDLLPAQRIENAEIDSSKYDEDNFSRVCPRCGFLFNEGE